MCDLGHEGCSKRAISLEGSEHITNLEGRSIQTTKARAGEQPKQNATRPDRTEWDLNLGTAAMLDYNQDLEVLSGS